MSVISRRQLLTRGALAGIGIAAAAGIGAAVAAVDGLPARARTAAADEPTGHTRAPIDPVDPAHQDELLAGLARETSLIAGLETAIEASPGDPRHGLLLSIQADHRAHADALSALLGAAQPTPSGGGAAPTVADIDTLRAAEHDAQAGASTSSAHLNGAAAVLLASIAACEAGHVELMT